MSKQVKKIFAYIAAIFWAFMTIFPLYVTFLSSVKDNKEINLGMFKLPEVWRWDNYIDAIESAGILRAIFNSLFLALTTTALVILVGMLAAYILSRKKYKIMGLISALFILGLMVPVHTTIIPINTMSTALGTKDSYLFLVLVYVAFNLSQAVYLLTGYLNGIDKEIDEAAIIDGCSDFHLLFRILFPLSKPMISTVAILTFVYGYGELIFSMSLITDRAKYTVSRAMLTFQGSYSVELGPIFACIILAVLPMLIIYLLFNEKVQSGMLAGAVKG